MVGRCAMSYVLNQPFEYWTSTQENKMASICPEFKCLGCLVFKWHLNTGPFGIQTFFNHLNTELVWYSDPHYHNTNSNSVHYNLVVYAKKLLIFEITQLASEHGIAQAYFDQFKLKSKKSFFQSCFVMIGK